MFPELLGQLAGSVLETVRGFLPSAIVFAIIFAVLSLFTIFMSMSLFAFPIVLITGKSLVAYANEDQLRWLVRLAFAALAVARLTQFVMYLPSGYSAGIMPSDFAQRLTPTQIQSLVDFLASAAK